MIYDIEDNIFEDILQTVDIETSTHCDVINSTNENEEEMSSN